MPITAYPQVNQVLNSLLSDFQRILRDDLVGVYLFGSLMAGDFDESISDIDLLVALVHTLDDNTFHALDHMHEQTVQQFPQWNGRIEIAYVSAPALKICSTEPYKIGTISPGEPFHIIDSSEGWLMNWYLVQETGQTLFGKPKTDVIELISKAEYIQVVKEHTLLWHEWLKDAKDKSFLSYAVLTICRGVYTVKHKHPASKIVASAWAKNTYPQWETLIDNALKWRYNPTIDDLTPDEVKPQVEALLVFMTDVLT
jgi:predicted nucleotidyltransferase